jgi:hypothetical protein
MDHKDEYAALMELANIHELLLLLMGGGIEVDQQRVLRAISMIESLHRGITTDILNSEKSQGVIVQ